MIAPFNPIRPTELSRLIAPLAGGAAPKVRGSLLMGLMGFFCFMPYSSLPVGNRTSLQFGHFFAMLVCVPVLFMAWRRRPFWIFLAVLAPLYFSTFAMAVTGRGDVTLSFKSIVVWTSACVMIVAGQVGAPRHALALLTGAALATLMHFFVGVWQLFAFQSGEFPLTWLYVNPAFLSVQDNAEKIAKYTQRPFGVFPEPSAMSSSLAPWVLFWTAHLCGLVKMRIEPARWQRALFSVAAAGGLALIIFSQSGHAVVTLAAASLFVAGWFLKSKATYRTYAGLVAVCGVVIPVVLWLAVSSLSNRMGGEKMGNSSWEERSSSLVIGFRLVVGGDFQTLLCGYGPGMMSPILQRVYRLEAVWSVLLNYLYETGIIGLLGVFAIGLHQLNIWRKSRFSLAFAAITVVWLVGITITTSYNELLSLWMTLGWLSVWPEICRPQEKATVTVRAGGRNRETSNRKRLPAWFAPRPAAAEPLSMLSPKRWTEE